MTPHIEKHFTAGDAVRDVVIGMSDGLTVPFALAAGLTGAISQTHLIVTAGFAEIAAGSIAMGLGGYLAARGDAEHYTHEQAREEHEIKAISERRRKRSAISSRPMACLARSVLRSSSLSASAQRIGSPL